MFKPFFDKYSGDAPGVIAVDNVLTVKRRPLGWIRDLRPKNVKMSLFLRTKKLL